MNDLVSLLGLQAWKPLLTVLLLPPIPLLLLVLLGARLIPRRRGWGWSLLLLAVAGLWGSACSGLAEALQRPLLSTPPALEAARLQALRQQALRQPTVVVVLGGGREDAAPEYGGPSLNDGSLQRLRYGLWLARQTGAPVAFSGGVGWADRGSSTEAEVAAAIAAKEFGLPLRWTESTSRDTRENAAATLALLQPAGVRRVLLVSHGWHLPRAVRAFEDAARNAGLVLDVVPAPMALAPRINHPVLRWVPSGDGLLLMRQVLREALGRLAGA